MAYVRKPNYHFRTKLDTGIDKVPNGRVVVVEDYDGITKTFMKVSSTGLTILSTIVDAITGLNTKELGSSTSGVFINTPTITSPATGTTDFTGAVVGSVYSTSDTFQGVHDYTNWQLSYTSDFAIIQAQSTVGNLTSWTPSVNLPLQNCYIRVRYGSASYLSSFSTPILVTTPNIYVVTPTITVTGTPSSVIETPVLSSSAFSVFNGTSTHSSTDWIIKQNGTTVWSSITNTTNKLTITVPASVLVVNTLYTFEVRHNSSTYGSSAYGSITGTTLSSFFDPLLDHPAGFGEAYQGGFYAGKVTKSDGIYAIVVAPKALGENNGTTLAYKTTNDTTSGTQSLVQGLENSNSMNTSNHPAAFYCNNLVINGYSDWYLPSRDELELCYRNLKPDTTANNASARSDSAIVYAPLDDTSMNQGVNRYSVPVGTAYTSGSPVQTVNPAFRTGGAEAFLVGSYYWSSTEYSSTLAWIQFFGNGGQGNGVKASLYYVRGVRGIKLS
ncbi:MAG: Lcl domain-containing protein [Sulfuricurvum sp.]